jgi:hypothetical protein
MTAAGLPTAAGMPAAPDACSLPTAERPTRVAEFDDLFATAVTWVERPEPTRLRLGLPADPEVAGRAANLAVRESDCCTFFTFALTTTGPNVHLEVTVPAAYAEVLDGLAARVPTAVRSVPPAAAPGRGTGA